MKCSSPEETHRSYTAGVAQSVELRFRKPWVGGSNPLAGSTQAQLANLTAFLPCRTSAPPLSLPKEGFVDTPASTFDQAVEESSSSSAVARG